uniref:serine carboxypeptidase 1-like n=1 Tax=Erigeron canadensis TaxID=72917 RepID=UPI001CB9A297|nr:serine carboxypeptidase 1-like [Erigeron canadensis]
MKVSKILMRAAGSLRLVSRFLDVRFNLSVGDKTVGLNVFCILSNADIQANRLFKLLNSKRSKSSPVPNAWSVSDETTHQYSPVYIAQQDGLAQLDKINALPGQPAGVNLNQYSGYVTVNQNAGRAVFYYFVESPTDSSTKPLVLWLNGGIFSFDRIFIFHH